MSLSIFRSSLDQTAPCFQVPLSKLDRVKNIARSSLVTLPKFVQDQQKYKAILRQIGRLNGILPEHSHLSAGPNQQIRRRAKRLPRKKRLLPGAEEPEEKKENLIRRRKAENSDKVLVDVDDLLPTAADITSSCRG